MTVPEVKRGNQGDHINAKDRRVCRSPMVSGYLCLLFMLRRLRLNRLQRIFWTVPFGIKLSRVINGSSYHTTDRPLRKRESGASAAKKLVQGLPSKSKPVRSSFARGGGGPVTGWQWSLTWLDVSHSYQNLCRRRQRRSSGRCSQS